MITRLPRVPVVLGVVVFVLASALLTFSVWRSVGGSTPLQPKKYEVNALFDNASQLEPNADVRIAGVSVGKVARIKPRGLSTEATLAINHQYAPLSGGVRAILRQKTLLGETFVELAPGRRSAGRLADGGTIPRRHIGRTQPIDRFLGLLDKPTRRNIVSALTNTGAVFEGRGQDFNDTLGNFESGSRQLGVLVDVLDHQRGEVSSLVRNTGTVFRTIGERQGSVQALVRNGNSALSATSEHAAALTSTVRAAAPFLRELRASSNELERTIHRAAPTVRGFKPVAPQIAPTLRTIRTASPQLRSLLVDFNRLVPVARRGLLSSARFTKSLSPLMSALGPAAAQLAPVISYMGQYRRELIATMANSASALGAAAPGNTGTSINYLRALIPVNQEGYMGYSSRVSENRHAAYESPGTLTDLPGGLPSSNCAGTRPSSSAPSCRLQPLWSFGGGAKRYYQHVDASRASGR